MGTDNGDAACTWQRPKRVVISAATPANAGRLPAFVAVGTYAFAVLSGASLVFLVQPLAARLVLPRFGGSPAVWTTSLLFFQAALLVGYGWAHLSIGRLGLRRQPWVQCVLLLVPLLVLPIALPSWASPPTDAEPSIWLLLVLAAAVGLPYVAVTTASPTLQRWFAATNHPRAADPYFLYVIGNAGSLIGLLAYPLLIEPNLSLRDQALLWSAGYVAFVALTAAAAAIVRLFAGSPETDHVPHVSRLEARRVSGPEPRPALRRRMAWIAMAFVPSSLMLGVTTYISTDIAAVPLLWVLPLSLYLITFMIAFSPRSPLTLPRLAALLPIAVVALSITLSGAVRLPLGMLIGVNLVVFFVAALLAHARLAADRPPVRYLTEFYLLLAVGGALGGLFNALVAPVIFDSVVEYPLALTLALLLRPVRAARDPVAERRARFVDLMTPAVSLVAAVGLLALLSRAFGLTGSALATALGLVAIGTLAFVRRPVRFGLSLGGLLLIPILVGSSGLYSERGFFGVNRVVDEGGGIRLLVHGTTVHGAQFTDPARAGEPLTYYHRSGPLGRALTAFQSTRPGPLRIGGIGLGAGDIAAYVRPQDTITFFEIDPAVARIARDPSLFTFLDHAAGAVRVVVGDGRLQLAREPQASFDVLVLDAFSGDAPPAHLLTVEAIDLYLRALAPGGILLFNTSNRNVDVQGVVVAGLRARGLPVVIPIDPDPSTPPPPEKEPSSWVLSARSPDDISATVGLIRTVDPPSDTVRAWTDDFSDLISAIRWDR